MEIYDERTDKSIPVAEILDNLLWDEEDTDVFCDAAEDQVSDSSDDHQIWRSDDETCRVYYCYASNGGTNVTLTDLSVDWQEYFKSWDWDLWGDYNSMLADFGIEPELIEAAEDYEGPCKIWIEYNYYQGTLGAPTDGWSTDERGEIREFENREEAQAYIDAAEKGTYYLSHGEAGRPTYTICEA